MTAGAHTALASVAAGSGKQTLTSAVFIVVLGVGATVRHLPGWLGMFGLIIVPLAAPAAVARLNLLMLPERQDWRWAWSLLVATIGAASVVAQGLYHAWMRAHDLGGLSDAQAMAVAAGSATLLLALPLRYAQMRGAEQHLATLTQAALASELKALQAQIEPHFLYNTLANARYLARVEPEKAVHMLDHLIAYLHSALPDMRSASSTLARECELAEHYLALMEIRFGARLTYEIDCPPELRAASMPPLMLMSLVENAVQHGVEPQPGEVCVSLLADVDGGQLRVRVIDNGAGFAPTALGNGVGLRNVGARLQALYGSDASFALHIADGMPTEAELRLPLHFDDAASTSGSGNGGMTTAAATMPPHAEMLPAHAAKPHGASA
jgi:signal transduction histidine kinase